MNLNLTEAEYRNLTMVERAQYWCERYNHTQELLDQTRRERDIALSKLRRMRDILGERQ